MNNIKTDEWFKENGYEFITPEIAQRYLIQNRQNRKIRNNFVNDLIKKIDNDQWQPFTLDAIGFYEDGTLANGQHRLTAISKSNKGVWVKVERNIPKEAVIAIDTGRNRSASDNVKILTGKDFYTSKISNMIALSAAGSNNRSLTPEQHYKIAQIYEDDIIFIKDLFDGSPRYIQGASIMTATFLALENGVDRDKLHEFVSLLNKAIATNDYEASVVSFRNRLMQECLQKTGKVRHDYSWEIKRCENVIYHFVKGHPITNFISPANYRYNLIDFHV